MVHYKIGIPVSSVDTESIHMSSEDSSLEQAEELCVKASKPKRNQKNKDTKEKESNESYKKGSGDTEFKDNKSSTKKDGKDDTTRSSADTTRKSVRPRCKTEKQDTRVTSTPVKSEDAKNRPENRAERGKKRANNDDDPMLRDEKDLDESIQGSGKETEATRAQYSGPTTSYDMMITVDPDEAKENIIGTFNSYSDERFPSQGTFI